MDGTDTGRSVTVRASSATVEVLQDLQVLLGVDAYPTAGRVLEHTLLWYSETIGEGTELRFSPPDDRAAWEPYGRSLDLVPASTPEPSPHLLRIEGEAAARLAGDAELERMIEEGGLEQIVRLKAEQAMRTADGWKVEAGQAAAA